MKNKIILYNSRGAIVISTIVVITIMVAIMAGVGVIQVTQLAKESYRANESLRYLTVMEEMGQIVGRARMLGRAIDRGETASCPAGTTLATAGAPAMKFCVPGTGIDTTCITHTDGVGATQTYCLKALSVVANAGASANPAAVTALSGNPASSGTESTSSATWNTNYHNEDAFFPTPTWTTSVTIRTPLCGTDPQTQLGCMICTEKGVTCVEFQFCPFTNSACTGNYQVQRIAVY